MITVNSTPFDNTRKKIQELIRRLKSDNYIKKIADLAVDLIYKRVKSGFGVNDDSSENSTKIRLIALGGTAANPTIARRKYLRFRQNISLGPFGTPGKSNLTLTGQMLEALYSKITSNGFIIDIKNNIRTKIGNESKTITNKQVANYVSEKRPFLALTIQEQRVILKEYENIVRELARMIT